MCDQLLSHHLFVARKLEAFEIPTNRLTLGKDLDTLSGPK